MSTTEHHASFRSSWIWLAILGVISIAGGLLALANPSAATFAAVLLAAWTFLIFGVLQVIQAFQMRGWSGFWWSLAFGVLTFLVGLSLLVNPLAGALSLTVVVAVLFIVVGVVKLIYASRLRPMSGWGWGVASGILSIILGIMIIAGFPWSAATILGILLAIELLSNGVFLLLLAFGLRRL